MTVTTPHTTQKSAKKRARHELEEDERHMEDAAIATPSKTTKRQNLSKTPVRMKTTAKMSGDSLLTPTSQAHVGVPTATNPLPPRSAALYMNQNSHKKNKNSYSEDKADNLLEPPPPPPPPPVTPTQQLAPRELPTSPEKHGNESLIIRGMRATKESVEVSQQGSVDEDGLSQYAGICILVLVILLALVSGLWSFDRMSSQITIGALRQDMQNCRALQSQDRKQDEYYVKELETEIRVWRQEAKAKHVELEALRTECQLSKESV